MSGVADTQSSATPPQTVGSGPVWPGIGATLLGCALWAGLALANPTTTYHLGPVLSLLAWPVVVRGQHPRTGWSPGVLAAAGATALVAVTTGVLVGRDALAGPALIGANATVETLVLVVASGAAALALARGTRTGALRRRCPARS